MSVLDFSDSSAKPRLEELVSDCNEWYSEIAGTKQYRISCKIAQINCTLVSDFHRERTYERIVFPDGEMIYDSFPWLKSLVDIPEAVYGLSVAWKSINFDNEAAGLRKLIKCPEWFKFSSGSKRITFDINSVVNPNSNYNIQLKALQNAIQACLETRKNLYKAYLFCEILYKYLRMIEVSLASGRQSSWSEIEWAVNHMVNCIKEEMEALPDQEVYRMLADRDKERGSWTKADGPNSYIVNFSKEVQEDIMRSFTGCVVKANGSDMLYLVEGGVRHYIPSLAVFSNFFKNLNVVQVIDESKLQSIPLGAPLSQDAGLIKGKNSDVVYFCSDHIKRRFHSNYDFNHMLLDVGKIKVLPPAEIDKIPTGPDFIGVYL